MSDAELTVSILREIRDSIRTLDTNLSSRVDATNKRLDMLTEDVNQRFDVLTDRVDVLTERVGVVEHAVRDAGQQILLLTRYLNNKTEVEIEDLRLCVGRLETKVG